MSCTICATSTCEQAHTCAKTGHARLPTFHCLCKSCSPGRIICVLVAPQADRLLVNTCGSSYVREEVQELACLNEANLTAIKEIIGEQVEQADGTVKLVDTSTSHTLRKQGRRWAQHVVEGPISWMMSAAYIFGTVIAGATPLSTLLDAVKRASGDDTLIACCPIDARVADASLLLHDATAALGATPTAVTNASILQVADLLSHATELLGKCSSPENNGWQVARYLVATLDAIICACGGLASHTSCQPYTDSCALHPSPDLKARWPKLLLADLFLPWWTTVLLRLIQGRPWLHRVAGRSVLVGDVTCQGLEHTRLAPFPRLSSHPLLC